MSLSNSFPLWISTLDGNANDKKTFHEVDKKFRAFRKQLKQSKDPLVVGDSALYSSELLERSAKDIDFYWLTRVPESIADAKKLCMSNESCIDWTLVDNGYKISNYIVTRQNIKQRWQLVFSEKAYVSECKTFKNRLSKTMEKCKQEISKLKTFACEEDAHKYIDKICKKWKYHKFEYKLIPVFKHKKRGRPSSGSCPDVVSYRVDGGIIENSSAIKSALNTKGRFVLATNQFDTEQLPDEKLLSEYKGQSAIEKGFRFLKDPWFMVSSVFLKKNTRIEALMAIMTLCLMVYNFAEREMRKQLKNSGTKLPLQTKKLTEKPTLKWVFQLMEGISEITVTPSGGKGSVSTVISNLKDVHIKIISCFSPYIGKIYGINNGTAP